MCAHLACKKLYMTSHTEHTRTHRHARAEYRKATRNYYDRVLVRVGRLVLLRTVLKYEYTYSHYMYE